MFLHKLRFMDKIDFRSDTVTWPTQAMRDTAYDIAAWKVEDPFDGYGSPQDIWVTAQMLLPKTVTEENG